MHDSITDVEDPKSSPLPPSNYEQRPLPSTYLGKAVQGVQIATSRRRLPVTNRAAEYKKTVESHPRTVAYIRRYGEHVFFVAIIAFSLFSAYRSDRQVSKGSLMAIGMSVSYTLFCINELYGWQPGKIAVFLICLATLASYVGGLVLWYGPMETREGIIKFILGLVIFLAVTAAFIVPMMLGSIACLNVAFKRGTKWTIATFHIQSPRGQARVYLAGGLIYALVVWGTLRNWDAIWDGPLYWVIVSLLKICCILWGAAGIDWVPKDGC